MKTKTELNASNFRINQETNVFILVFCFCLVLSFFFPSSLFSYVLCLLTIHEDVGRAGNKMRALTPQVPEALIGRLLKHPARDKVDDFL